MMKNYLFVLPLLSLLILPGCKKDENEEPEKILKVYHTNPGEVSPGELISPNETLPLTLGRTKIFTIETTSKNISILYDKNSVEIEKSNHDESVYYCYPKTAGLPDIMILAEDMDLSVDFELDIQPASCTYRLFENAGLVDVEDPLLKKEILTELERYYFPAKGKTTFRSYTQGEMELLLQDGEIGLEGMFELDRGTNYLNFIVNNGEGKNRRVEMIKHEVGLNICYMIQYLTDEFREKYPSEIINEVKLSSVLVIESGNFL